MMRDQVRGVGQVAVVQDEFAVIDVRILIQMIDAVGIKQRGAALDAVHDVALLQQKFSQISAVLASDAGDECNFIHCNTFFMINETTQDPM